MSSTSTRVVTGMPRLRAAPRSSRSPATRVISAALCSLASSALSPGGIDLLLRHDRHRVVEPAAQRRDDVHPLPRAAEHRHGGQVQVALRRDRSRAPRCGSARSCRPSRGCSSSGQGSARRRAPGAAPRRRRAAPRGSPAAASVQDAARHGGQPTSSGRRRSCRRRRSGAVLDGSPDRVERRLEALGLLERLVGVGPRAVCGSPTSPRGAPAAGRRPGWSARRARSSGPRMVVRTDALRVDAADPDPRRFRADPPTPARRRRTSGASRSARSP